MLTIGDLVQDFHGIRKPLVKQLEAMDAPLNMNGGLPRGEVERRIAELDSLILQYAPQS